jgi:hypothetical protein
MDEKTAKIVSSINEGRPVTDWEVGHMLEVAAKALKENRLSFLKNAEACAVESAENVAEVVADAMHKITAAENILRDRETVMIQQVSETFKRYRDALRTLNGRIESLPELHAAHSTLNVIERAVAVAKELEGVSDTGWARLETVAKALKQED